jgi:antitoxin YefM
MAIKVVINQTISNSETRFGVLSIQEYIPVTQAKSKLLDIIRKLEASDDTIAITKNGVPEAVMISMKTYEGLLETLEILSDETTMASLRKSIMEAQAGKWLDFEEVFEE